MEEGCKTSRVIFFQKGTPVNRWRSISVFVRSLVACIFYAASLCNAATKPTRIVYLSFAGVIFLDALKFYISLLYRYYGRHAVARAVQPFIYMYHTIRAYVWKNWQRRETLISTFSAETLLKRVLVFFLYFKSQDWRRYKKKVSKLKLWPKVYSHSRYLEFGQACDKRFYSKRCTLLANTPWNFIYRLPRIKTSDIETSFFLETHRDTN